MRAAGRDADTLAGDDHAGIRDMARADAGRIGAVRPRLRWSASRPPPKSSSPFRFGDLKKALFTLLRQE